MERSVLLRYFPSFHRIALSCHQLFVQIRNHFTWAWVKLGILLSLCFLWVCLWAESHTWHRYAGQEFALGARGVGVLVQATSYPGTLHLLMMSDRSQQSPTFSLQRLTYLGNGGYPLGHGFTLLGFVFSLLPYEFDGGDYEVSPHVALAVPYWFLTAATVLFLLKYAGWLPQIRPSLGHREAGADKLGRHVAEG